MSFVKTVLLGTLLLGLSVGHARSERVVALPAMAGGVGSPLSAHPGNAAGPFGLTDGERSAFSARAEALSHEVAADRTVLALCRLGYAGCPEAARRFAAIINEARLREGRARLGEVNRSVNLALTYLSDAAQHGRADVWSSPLATFASQAGDCEDYAIAKYVALLELGSDEGDLRLVVVRGAGGTGHAVLAARSGEEWLILDNRHSLLVADRDLARYAPVASLDLARAGGIGPG